MFNFNTADHSADIRLNAYSGSHDIGGSALFWSAKRVFDIGLSLVLLPVLCIAYAALMLLNPFFNRGRIFFIQTRMGQNCKPFQAIKFRSMRDVAEISRGADDPLEMDRITRLGHFLRKSRLDELPQIINVLRGEMSLIGPRPDYYEHAAVYLEIIPGYRMRHTIRPGISGLAQTKLGYVEGCEGTRSKVMADLEYIQNAGFQADSKVFLSTIATVALRAGA